MVWANTAWSTLGAGLANRCNVWSASAVRDFAALDSQELQRTNGNSACDKRTRMMCVTRTETDLEASVGEGRGGACAHQPSADEGQYRDSGDS
jgi:hypothetical protein